MKFSNSIFWNGLDYKNIKYKFLLFIDFVEVGVDILIRYSLSWSERKVFLEIFEVILSQHGHYKQRFKIPKHFKKHIEKVTFCTSSIYIRIYTYIPKKFNNNSVNVKSSRTGFFALLKEFKNFKNFLGVQETVYLHYLRTFWKIFLWKIILT